jgi:hypothetical protein
LLLNWCGDPFEKRGRRRKIPQVIYLERTHGLHWSTRGDVVQPRVFALRKVIAHDGSAYIHIPTQAKVDAGIKRPIGQLPQVRHFPEKLDDFTTPPSGRIFR